MSPTRETPGSADLIPHLSSPLAMSSSPLPSPPLSPKPSSSHHRSKTAPAPLDHIDLKTIPTSSSHEPQPSTPSPRSPETPMSPGQAPGVSTTPAHPSSALRRTSSSLSANSTPGSREKKRLRFTPVPVSQAEAGPSGLGIDVGEVFFPGGSVVHAEEGRGRGRKGVPRDQADYLRSDPGTPNLSET